MKRLFLFAAALAAPLIPLAAAPARAATVTVDLQLSALTLNQAGAHTICPVQVAAGANGLAVLDAAKAAGCIVSYTTAFGGAFVDCINEVCSQYLAASVAGARTAGTYWAMYLNGGYTTFGVADYTASNGDALLFDYEHFVF